MAENIPMLALSPTMEEGVIVKWVKNEGDTVQQGDVLCEVETDKATMEYESPASGVLLKILAPEGASVPVGKEIAIIGEAGEAAASKEEQPKPEKAAEKPTEAKKIPEKPAKGEKRPEPEKPAEEKRPKPQTVMPITEEEVRRKEPAAEGKVLATPLARRLAKERGVDLAAIKGSGPEGRITRDDVEAAAAGAPAAGRPGGGMGILPMASAPAPAGKLEDKTIEVTPKRKVIADTLSGSKFSAPHFYLKVTAGVENLMAARARLNQRLGAHVSVNAFLMKFVAETLKRHPMINATWTNDAIVQHAAIDIALAVAQPDGLIAPVVRDCGAKGILQIDRELKALVEKTRKGALTRADYADSTFTISSLGTYGIEEFTAIINPPGSAILAVGEFMKICVADENEQICAKLCAKLTLSCDHRLIDGTIGAGFLRDLKQMIEYPIEPLY